MKQSGNEEMRAVLDNEERGKYAYEEYCYEMVSLLLYISSCNK